MENGDDNLHLAFIHMYFDVDERSTINEITNYINNENNYIKILNYLNEIELKFIVGDATTDTFKYVMPQFKFVCERDYTLEILKFDFGGVFLKKGAVVFATNLFVADPAVAMEHLIKQVPQLTSVTHYVNRTIKTDVGEKFYLWNGTDGIVFTRPYLDWMGLKVCNGTPYTENNKYRLYIVGDELAKVFIETKISAEGNIPYSELKNYHKGTPLRYARNNPDQVINYKTFTTNNFDVVFDAFEEEFSTHQVNTIHFIQRDYIFDAKNFPLSLLNELQKCWVSNTSVYKIINKFSKRGITENEIVIDRYGANKYKKMVVGANYSFPVNKSSDLDHLFIPNDMFQLRHTLNAAVVPKLGLVILATHVFFGARLVLDFNPKNDLNTFVKTKIKIKEDDIFYHVGGSYFLEETTFLTNDVPVFIVVRINDDLIVRHNLKRVSRKLSDLKHNWVLNTILNLFVRKTFNGHI
ncbi:P49 [Diatraea saccharalis granulovirus]|uniref:p49 n=1 Tax=Diatraea saccharalis granulovirus TaxID=1675862 RepID=A0A0R7EYV2_9BBAC|nr:P49 [Diatraea saccharalis granulovirus]AKN80772.1 P49 [Diatraea saccharalis granulovirus]